MTKRTDKHKDPGDPLIEALEQGIKSVLNDKDATVKEKMAAIAAGTKVAAIKHKISGGDDKGGFFD